MLGGRLPGGVRCLQRSHLARDHAGIRTMATAPDTVRIVEVRIAYCDQRWNSWTSVLTNDSSLLLNALHSPFYWRIL
jgi:hypothetical protein